ncbi:MAG: F0F1 ATP synthase subunit A [Ruminococcaceae bacterium]|nr:F0F1 ATP synthase subunit A [Oscillospiraceae bacterium]
MSQKRRLTAVDILLLLGAILPIVAIIVLQILTKPASEGISLSGAYIYFTVDMPLQPLYITEAQINSWAVIITVTCLCLFLTRGMKVDKPSARQHLAEWIVEKTEGLVKDNMDPFFSNYGPFICAILGLSAFSSLLSLFGLFPPTSDLNVVGGWAVLVFILITYYKFKCGPWGYAKSFAQPVALLTPINIISEVATPISMAFRHYGNVLSGTVISVLVASGLGGLSAIVLGWLPGVLGDIPFLRIGIPAILSIYFDVFSGCLQAFIFAMLTMMYVSGAFPAEDYAARRAKIEAKKQNKLGGN